jgi:anti-sigma regulatory factor (Ser/Thr protein kinase)
VVSDTPAEASLEPHRKAAARQRITATRIAPRSPDVADAVWLIVLQGDTGAPRQARHEIAERLNGELGSERRKDALLLTGELVANSVVHAGGEVAREILLELVIDPEVVRVVVTDTGSTLVPKLRQRSATLESGRGLLLVEQLSDRWGMMRDGNRRTRVWFEILREPPEPT